MTDRAFSVYSSPPDLAALATIRKRCKDGTARAIRVEACLSAAEVAARAGCSPSSVIHWERGERRPYGDAALRYGALIEVLRTAASTPESAA